MDFWFGDVEKSCERHVPMLSIGSMASDRFWSALETVAYRVSPLLNNDNSVNIYPINSV